MNFSPLPISDLGDAELGRAATIDELESHDSLRPGVAGALAGSLGAAAAFAVVRELEPARVAGELQRWQMLTSLDAPVAFGAMFLAVALLGALLGATLAALTRNLRRYLPLLLWSLIFFTSLVTVGQVLAHLYLGAALLPARTLFAGAAAFAAVWSLSLPLRRAGRAHRLPDPAR